MADYESEKSGILRQMAGRDLIAMSDLSKEEIIALLDLANDMKKQPAANLLQDIIMGCCFFEPSTRTRLSFESAIARLGGRTVGFSDSGSTSVKKGESMVDTIRMMESYADVVVIRHPLAGAAKLAADILKLPVINAGDGANEHPTQTLQDLFTIQEHRGTLDNLHIAIAGDLKNGRTAHSLVEGLTYFNARIYFIAPQGLEAPKDLCDRLRAKGIKFTFHENIEEVLSKVEILYMTRLQKERLGLESAFDMEKYRYCIHADMLKHAKAELGIMHPLPRNHEIDVDVDALPQALYFKQAANGINMRQAILSALLGKVPMMMEAR